MRPFSSGAILAALLAPAAAEPLRPPSQSDLVEEMRFIEVRMEESEATMRLVVTPRLRNHLQFGAWDAATWETAQSELVASTARSRGVVVKKIGRVIVPRVEAGKPVELEVKDAAQASPTSR